MDNYKEIGKQPPLGQLNTGLLFLDFERLTSEPEYEAIERMTYGHSVVQKRYQYSHDLVRALTEAKLTTKLRSLIKKEITSKLPCGRDHRALKSKITNQTALVA